MKLEISKTNISFVTATPMQVATVIKGISDYEEGKPAQTRINYRPIYQRGDAWNQDFKEKLILSILVGFPIGNIILRTLKNDNQSFMNITHEVVDGQQRLLAIKDFLKGRYSLNSIISKSILEQKKELFEYDVQSGLNNPACKIYKKYLKNSNANYKLSFQDLPTTLQASINTYALVVIPVEADDESIAQYFRFIQNQERLRAGEIINSIPDSYLLSYLIKIEDRDAFLNKINWNESRKEFEKIFYSMIGIYDEKLNFGTTDESIIDYVANVNDISNDANVSTLRMIDAINAITKCSVKNHGKFSKRLIKFFMLSAGFGVVDYTAETEKKFNSLLSIESKLPYFNSGKQEKIMKHFNGYTENIIAKHNELFILGRGSHSSKSTRKVISNLSELINYEIEKNC
jgi:uncharacterized protein with ParB-like and HNH nuclease domain